MKVWVVMKVKEYFECNMYMGFDLIPDAVYSYKPSKKEIGGGKVFEMELTTRRREKNEQKS